MAWLPRAALYVLDGLLENNTILRLREHYTDTHGVTEHIFGLCYLLGYSFMPRLRDLADQIADVPAEDFGLTLGRWGFSTGPYLVVPVLGPSNIPDQTGLAGDYALNPQMWYLSVSSTKIYRQRGPLGDSRF